MKQWFVIYVIILATLPGCLGVTELPATPADVKIVAEQPVIEIPLSGPVAEAKAEVSGMTWYEDWLILLPQYPAVVGNNLYAIPRVDIIAFLDGQRDGSLTPQAVAFNGATLRDLPNFEGFEAIAFNGNDVYLTIETDQGFEMLGYLVTGKIEPDLSELRVDATTTVSIAAQSPIDNYSEEAVLFIDETVVTLYEANGSNVNADPVAHRFDPNLTDLGTVSFPTIEYRITDATTADANGRFWAINYIFEGAISKLKPAPDPLIAQYGIGATHAESNIVERLIEFQYTAEGIVLTNNPPLQLTLRSDGTARNWEGVARLDDRGFLLVTDKFPTTILAFVPAP